MSSWSGKKGEEVERLRAKLNVSYHTERKKEDQGGLKEPRPRGCWSPSSWWYSALTFSPTVGSWFIFCSNLYWAAGLRIMTIIFPVALLPFLLRLSSWEEGWGSWEWHFRKPSHLGNRAHTLSLQGSPRYLQWLPSTPICGRLSQRSLTSRLLMFTSWAALSSCSWHSWSMLLSTTYSSGEAPGSKRNRVNGSARPTMNATVMRRRGWETRFVPFFHCGRRIQTLHCSFSPGWAMEQPLSSSR